MQGTQSNQEWGLHIKGVYDALLGVQLSQLMREAAVWRQNFNQDVQSWLSKQTLSAHQVTLVDLFNKCCQVPNKELSPSEIDLCTSAVRSPSAVVRLVSSAVVLNDRLGKLICRKDLIVEKAKTELASIRQLAVLRGKAVGLSFDGIQEVEAPLLQRRVPRR